MTETELKLMAALAMIGLRRRPKNGQSDVLYSSPTFSELSVVNAGGFNHGKYMSVYAYADESGNTGANLFDPAQPIFYAAAVIAKFDVDAEFERLFYGFARTEGFTHLHAAEMGLGRLSKIFRKLETRILRDDIRFFTAKIIKRDLVVAKVFDTVFDPHENKAVPWHAYWAREMRFIAMIKLNYIVTDEILRGFLGFAGGAERD